MVDQQSESQASFGHDLVGEYVGGDDGSSVAGRILLGKVASFDGGTKLFKVIYEDGQSEGLEHQEVQNILLVDNGGSGMKLSVRKRKLDQLVPSVLATNGPNTRSKKNPPEMVPNRAPQAQPLVSRLGSDLSRDADSSSDADSSMQQSMMPSLPPSSGDISVPEDSVPNLLSVYNFLRSFSLQLFLSPFGLHDFVGALNCMSQNSLMDAIHLSQMQALRRHLETLSSDGSVLASKCLRSHDWTLLDTLTWPAFLVEYLCIMGFMKGLQKEGFSVGALQSEYYCLHVAVKLKVLQILCDDMIGSSELRTELEMREDLEEEKENIIDATSPLENSPRRVHPRHSKTSAWKNMQALESSAEAKNSDPIPTVMELGTDATNASPDGNSDECMLCGMDGTLICCDSCPSSYHSRCIGLNKASLPDGLWFCPECTVNKLEPTSSRIGRGTSGAEVFGIDTYGHLFMGTCNYLLVDSVKCNTCQGYCHKNCTVSSTMHNDGNTELLFTCNPCYCAKCASCQLDVLLRDAVKCNTCEGHCHKNCTVSLTMKKDGNLRSLLLCSTCYRAKCAEIAKSHQEALNRQLSSQAQAQRPTGIKCVLRLGSHKNTQENEKLEGHLVKSSLASSSRKEHKERKRGESSLTYGLIWKKNVKDEKNFGTSFLVENIIYKSKEGVEPSSIQPVCRLCHSEYRSDIMYVRCQTCQCWYHADALNLEESLLSDLLGFRCCKCRRIVSPSCPYQKLDVGHSRQRNAGRSKRATSKLVRSTHDTTLLPQSGEGEDLIMLDDEPSLGSIDPLDENAEIDIDPISNAPKAFKEERCLAKKWSFAWIPRISFTLFDPGFRNKTRGFGCSR